MSADLEPGLKATTRTLARRIDDLEQAVVTHGRNGDRMQALYAAHTAAYLRRFLAEFIGPAWHQWAAGDWPVPKSARPVLADRPTAP